MLYNGIKKSDCGRPRSEYGKQRDMSKLRDSWSLRPVCATSSNSE